MCIFEIAWIGTCKQEPDKDFCEKHAAQKCKVCGEQSLGECDATPGGSFVCGYAICKNKCHDTSHPPKK